MRQLWTSYYRMGAERVVLDTNVLISAALLVRGTPFRVLTEILRTGVLLFSDETFEEVATRLMRPKFDRTIEPELRERFLAELAVVGEWTTITGALTACRDPEADKILETALAGEAQSITTGDGDLLALNAFQGIAILTPAAFLKLLSTPGE